MNNFSQFDHLQTNSNPAIKAARDLLRPYNEKRAKEKDRAIKRDMNLEEGRERRRVKK